ncbi:endochitinase A1-like [Humulus lupulus]|uniref:endochitinase A1-like n=1 Tax=Humulus lupulus TaxID=3486 RepID=UPI002B4056D9|nr:endochitinase A1-like [Humulus lupulus]
MKTRGHGSSSKCMKSQQETLPESVPTATPSVPASIPAVSPTPGRRSKTTARKKVLALSGPISSSVFGASSKGVTFPNLDAEQIPASTVSLASSEGQIKAKPALGTSQSKSISTEDVSVPFDHDSESSLSPDVLTPKAWGKRKSKVVGSKKGKKAKVAKSKGTSSISDSSPLSRFKLKAKINLPPCTSSEEVSPESEDSQPELDPSLTEPNPEVPLDDLAEETDSEEDPSEASPVASDPKGTTPLAFPELSSKLAKQKGAPARNSDQSSFMFHKVYVRGNWYNFSTSEISKALNLVPVEIDDSIEFAKDQVLSELVGQAMVWEPSTSLRVTDLTHFYGAIFKFAMFNWMPTTHSSTITQDMAFLLFKIGTRVAIDLGAVIFDQIMSLSGAKHDHAPSTAQKVKGINLASRASGNFVTGTPAVPTDLGAVHTGITSLSVRFSLMEETQRQILASLATLNASSSPAP